MRVGFKLASNWAFERAAAGLRHSPRSKAASICDESSGEELMKAAPFIYHSPWTKNLRRILPGLLLALLAETPWTANSAQKHLPFTDYREPDFFPILPWDPLRGWDGKATEAETNGLQSLAECHFNFGGFVLPKDLDKCRKLGLAAIVLPAGDPLVPATDRKHWRNLSDEEIETKVRTLVKSTSSSPAAKGFFIMDEPSVKDFPALGKAVAAVKKYAPGKLAYINLFPDYATLGAPDISQLGTSNYTEYLERFVTEVKPQVLSYDNYTVQYSDDLKNPDVAASYFRNLLEVRRVGQKYHLPCLQIVSSNQLRPRHMIPSPANLLLQAYTTLAAGYRGVTWYTYYARGYYYAPINANGNRTLTWTYLKEVNRQIATLAPLLSRLASTGVYFTDPAPANGLPVLPGQLVEKLTSTTPMMLGEFSGPDGTYMMVVNLSLAQSANFNLTLKSRHADLQELCVMDGRLRHFPPGKDGFWLPAGQGVLLRAGK